MRVERRQPLSNANSMGWEAQNAGPAQVPLRRRLRDPSDRAQPDHWAATTSSRPWAGAPEVDPPGADRPPWTWTRVQVAGPWDVATQ